jgi:leader peptidase (prepilin peptidase)/N-methyltransferase
MVADLLTRIIPDQLVLALLPGGIALWLIDGFSGRSGWLAGLGLRILAGVAAGAFLFACGWLAAKIMHREAMGMGDVKLLAACGFLTGLADLPYLFFLSFITAALVAVPMLLKRLHHPDTEPEIAFGPYIALAALLVLVLNSQLHALWLLYLGLAVS